MRSVLFLATAKRRSLRCSSDDLPENIGPKISAIEPSFVFIAIVKRSGTFKVPAVLPELGTKAFRNIFKS